MWIFRGKAISDKDGKQIGEWVYGNLMHYPENDFIQKYNEFMVEVSPATVGLWTGLLDKNGEKIFENDKVVYEVMQGLTDNCPNHSIDTVVYHLGCFAFSNPIRDDNDLFTENFVPMVQVYDELSLMNPKGEAMLDVQVIHDEEVK